MHKFTIVFSENLSLIFKKMKALLKKLIAYDKLYPLLQNSAFYHFFKKTQASVARSLYGNPAEGFFLIGVT